MIVVVAALKGGVGKTTTAMYLAATAATGRRAVTLVDADPQASAADWYERAEDDPNLESIELAEAPTERLLAKALDRIEGDDVGVVDTPPGDERLMMRALGLADVVIIPTRVGGVETARVEAVLGLIPRKVPYGLVISSARTYTRDYEDTVALWADADVPIWGTVPERVAIASGPEAWLSPEGLDIYRSVWRRASRAARG